MGVGVHGIDALRFIAVVSAAFSVASVDSETFGYLDRRAMINGQLKGNDQ